MTGVAWNVHFVVLQSRTVRLPVVFHWSLVQTVFCLFVPLAGLLLPAFAKLASLLLHLSESVRAALIATKLFRRLRDERLRPGLLAVGSLLSVLLTVWSLTPRPVQVWPLLGPFQVLVPPLFMLAMMRQHESTVTERVTDEALAPRVLQLLVEVSPDPGRAVVGTCRSHLVLVLVVLAVVLVGLLVLCQVTFSSREFTFLAPLL